MLNLLGFLALVGFLASLLVHLASLFGLPVPVLALALHAGIFVVFVPAVRLQGKFVPAGGKNADWREMLRGCPAWMHRVVQVLFPYVFINFFAGVVGFYSMDDSSFRVFSGHWMLFYFVAYAIIHSHLQLNRRVEGPWRCDHCNRLVEESALCECQLVSPTAANTALRRSC